MMNPGTILANQPGVVRVLVILLVPVAVHLLVRLLRRTTHTLASHRLAGRYARSRTILSIGFSAAVFVAYFVALGFVLREFGLSLRAYLTSASIIGLAIGFGSQGIVQDVVTGITLIFSDLINVGDMVEVSGQAGIVRGIGVRFTEIENSFGARVFIPNRTISNVINYPRGYIRIFVDVTLTGEEERDGEIEAQLRRIVAGAFEQYPKILRLSPDVMGRFDTTGGRTFVRVKFRVWPGRGSTVEDVRNEIVAAAKALWPDYQPWMVTVNYEVEREPYPAPPASRR
jgi:small conductance mechanosensitive channel